MAPVVKAFDRIKNRNSKHIVVSTGQHNELLNPVLNFFGIVPDVNLEAMQATTSLNDLYAHIIKEFNNVIDRYEPDLVFVHGDTASAAAAATASFNRKIPVAHVEAGLRSNDMDQPWPEEFNRRLIDMASSLYFAPTQNAANNLLNEGVCSSKIFVTGNTVIDALLMAVSQIVAMPQLKQNLAQKFPFLDHDKKLILVTGHRRENFGDGIENICAALRDLAKRQDVNIVYPVHLNPNIRLTVNDILSNTQNIHLIEPVEYVEFVYLMMNAQVILTDSGGIQEEAPSLSKPVLVMRDVTERPEAIEAGLAKLVGTDRERIVSNVLPYLEKSKQTDLKVFDKSPFGNGRAAEKIINVAQSFHCNGNLNDLDIHNTHIYESDSRIFA